MQTSLADLLFPATQADLLSWVKARCCRHLPGEDAQRWQHLFSWQRLGDLIARRQIQTSDLRIFSNGRLVNPQALGVIDDCGELCPHAIQTVMRQGASLALSKIQGSDDGLWALACDIERRLGDKTSITAIASFSSVSAMPLHYDAQDILILQIDGRKHWTFFGEPVAGSGISRSLKNQPTAVSGSVTLNPGDVLFVPSGQHHQCSPDGRSLHLSILVKRLTGQDLVDQVRHRIAADPLFDATTPRGQGAETLEAYERALKARLIQMIEETSFAAMIDELDAAQQGVTGLDLIGRDPTGQSSARMTLLPRRRLMLPDGDAMRFAGHSLVLTPALRAALEWLDESGSMAVATLRAELAERHGAEEADKALKALVDHGIAAAQPD